MEVVMVNTLFYVYDILSRILYKVWFYDVMWRAHKFYNSRVRVVSCIIYTDQHIINKQYATTNEVFVYTTYTIYLFSFEQTIV